MCLGGHLAYRCAFDNRVAAAVCYFATDIHTHSLGQGKNDDSLDRAGNIRSELVMVRFFLLSSSISIRRWELRGKEGKTSFTSHKLRIKTRERKGKEKKRKKNMNNQLTMAHIYSDLWEKRQPRSPRRKGLDS